MIDRKHALPLVRQARELRISRGSVYYLPRPVSPADLAIMRRIDELHLEFPYAGSRMLRDLLRQEGIKIGLGLKARPTEKQMAPLAEPWRPLRGAAAHLWWSYYRAVKKREGVLAGSN